MTGFKDLTGQKFNKLTVIRLATDSPSGRIRWLCECDCQAKRRLIVQANNLQSGQVKSCGCIAKENHLKHGHTSGQKQSPEYTAWCIMISRCKNMNHPEFHLYGGAGKKVDELFISGNGDNSGFEMFLEEVGSRPSENHSIQLYPDPFGNYIVGNIRWEIPIGTKRLIDLTGQQFGKLTVLGFGGKHKRKILWRCQCSCDAHPILLVFSEHLRNGHTKSCGCLKETPNREYKTQRREEASPEYNIWYLMTKRCTDPIHAAYYRYGGRGITVCSRWLNGENGKSGYECFIEDMGRRPNNTYSLERSDNNKGYEKDNCIWLLKRKQGGNVRNNINITFNNKTQHLRAWAAEIGVSYMTLYGRRKSGWPIERMLTAPIGKQYRGRFE